MNILDIKDPTFIKKLDEKELELLANDIRNFLIESVSKTGGHLSSNLGVVELTIALHYVFDAPKDKFLFDVGHQSYIHKILTGRAKDFDKLRQFDGISGFQRRNESIYDSFEAGHSSTALSIGLGMAIGRDLNKENFEIIPVVGDGSLSSGLSLEALNHIGDLKTKMIIIFNDNDMSISKNVGALSKVFSNLRVSSSYINFKDNLKDYFNKRKKGDKYLSFLKRIRNLIKNIFIKDNIFSLFDIDYLGPIDGHDINALIKAFKAAKEKDSSVVIHVKTKKGKGYKYAENDLEGKWHGISKFDIESGKELNQNNENVISYSKLVADEVLKQMDNDPNIVVITPAMKQGSKLNDIANKYQDRFYDCGIAEDHALDFACGLALENKKPFVSIYSSFLQRAYDQLNHDVCRMNLPVVLGIDRASIVGEDGSSHQGVFDISFLNSLPNMIITEGKDFNEIKNLIDLAFNSNKPFAIRYPRGNIEKQEYQKKNLKLGKWEYLVNNDNRDAIIISYGNDVIKIKDMIIKNDLNYDLINARFIKPIDEKLLIKIVAYNKPIFIYTNDMIKGGLGDSVLETLNRYNINVPVYIFGVDDIYVRHGEIKKVKKYLKLDLEYLFKFIKKHA